MNNLEINGKSFQYIERHLKKQESFENHFKFEKRIFVPFESTEKNRAKINNHQKDKIQKRKCCNESNGNTNISHKRKILKRPKRFKTYYTDRKPLTITCFEFPRFGEQLLHRGRQTICKYYKNNELINDRLIQIKSAETVDDFYKIINNHIRNKREVIKNIEQYYDTSTVLAPSLKPLANETCLCTKDYYRLNNIFDEKQKDHCKQSPHLSKTTANAIKKFTITSGKTSIDKFIYLASECYNKYIQNYLSNLNECNKKVEEYIKRQSLITDYTGIEITKSKPLLLPEINSNKADKINVNVITNHLNKLNINLHTNCEISTVKSEECNSIKPKNKGQSPRIYSTCRSQDMSCSDSNNNSTESTNHMRDPPKIIFSDFSTENQSTQDKSDKDLSDNRSAIDKNCLAIPNTKYCSEARPP